jgi:hypothetical protein
MMSDERSAAEMLYGRTAREAPDPSFATSDNGHAEQGMPILLEGIRKAIDAGRNRGDAPIADALWRRQAMEAGGILAYLGKENAAAFHTFAGALSRPFDVQSPAGSPAEQLYPAQPEPTRSPATPLDRTSPQAGIHLAGIAEDLMALGGGAPRLQPSPKGATQFIFPNGMALRFDLKPGQYIGKQQPHINLQLPGVFNEHIKLLP